MKFKAAFFLLFVSSLVCAENVKIAVYHTNDIHGWIMARPAAFYAANPARLIGGASALAKVYRADKGPKLLLDSGDWFQGTPEGTLTKGGAVAEIFNALAYDAVQVGNHDFDMGEENLKALVKKIKVPVLGGNVYNVKDHSRVDYLTPWIVKEVGGVKVGLFGLLTTNMSRLTFAKNFAGLEFRREVDEAKDAVKALRAQGCQVIIALTHVGFESPSGGAFEGDQTLASQVEGIDLIVGGHSHTALRKPVRDATYGTLIVQTGSMLTAVGRVELLVDRESKRVVYSTGALMDLWIDETGQDEKIEEVVRRQSEEVGKAFDVVLATAAAMLARAGHGGGESSLGDWMTDCSRDWSKTDIAFQNSGGIRADMPAGPVTLRTIFNIMPFENYLVSLRMSGKLIREVLERGLGAGKSTIQVSGLQVSYNKDKPGGERVVAVTVAGQPLKAEAVYSVSALDFMVKGGDGFTAFDRAEKKEFSDVLMRDVLGWCAERQPLISPAPLNRLVLQGD